MLHYMSIMDHIHLLCNTKMQEKRICLPRVKQIVQDISENLILFRNLVT